MDDIRDMARDPRHRRQFEKLLYLAAKHGDTEQVVERLSWGIDPNCHCGKKGRTPLIANAGSFCPSAATVQALLAGGADPNLADHLALTALDYARRKLAKINARPRKKPPKSPSLDENDQLVLHPEEQEYLDELRAEKPELGREIFRNYWKERMRAARRVFNDPDEVEKIVEILEKLAGGA
jgi:hypothetical protein